MGRPKGTTSSATMVALREAAEQEFAVRGFAAARLEDIATRVGLTRPSLLHHFPTKDLLYQSVVEGLVGRLREALLAGMTSRGGFEDRLSATVGRFAEHLYDSPLPTQLFVRELQDGKGRGNELLLEQVVPLLELAESFIRQTGANLILPDLDVRGAILDVVGAVIFFAIAGPIRQALWRTTGDAQEHRAMLREHFVALARRLFLQVPAIQAQERNEP